MELGRSWLVIMVVQCEEPQESNTTMSIVPLDYSLSQLPRKKNCLKQNQPGKPIHMKAKYMKYLEW